MGGYTHESFTRQLRKKQSDDSIHGVFFENQQAASGFNAHTFGMPAKTREQGRENYDLAVIVA